MEEVIKPVILLKNIIKYKMKNSGQCPTGMISQFCQNKKAPKGRNLPDMPSAYEPAGRYQ